MGATTTPGLGPPPPPPTAKGPVGRPGQHRRQDGSPAEADADADADARGKAKAKAKTNAGVDPEAEPKSKAKAKIPSRRAARRAARRAPRRGRRVKRIVRRIELWSVLKVALLFYTCMYGVALAAVAALWGIANSAGLVDNFEGFMDDVGFENWQFYGQDMFRRAAVIGAIAVLTTTILTVVAVALVNVISELTGGIRFVVLEEEPEGGSRRAPRPRAEASSARPDALGSAAAAAPAAGATAPAARVGGAVVDG